MKRRPIGELPLHMMCLPGILLLAVYSYGPMLGIALAFKEFNPGKGVFGSPWVGWDHFVYLFQLPGTIRVIWNTFYISMMKIVAGLITPILIAILLNEVRKQFLKRAVQTLIYVPYFLSWVILSGIFIDILSPSNGIVNKLLGYIGLAPVFFLGSDATFPLTLVFTDLWKDFGFGTVVYLAALTAIHPSLYESAVMDGANRWKQTLYITLPGMLPMIVLMTTLSLGQVLNAGFDQVFNLYSPIVYKSGDIIDTFVYRIGIEGAQYSLATALGMLKSAVSLVLISSSYYLAYRFANYRIF